MRGVGIGVELDVERVRWRLASGVVELAIGIPERAGVSLRAGVKAGCELEVGEVGGDGAWLVVVEDNSVGEDGTADAQIEDRRVAAGVAALEGGNIRDAVFVDVDLYHGVVDANAVEVPLSSEDRNDADARLRMLYLKERRIGMRARTVDLEAVEIDAESGEVELEVLKVNAGVQGF